MMLQVTPRPRPSFTSTYFTKEEPESVMTTTTPSPFHPSQPTLDDSLPDPRPVNKKPYCHQNNPKSILKLTATGQSDASSKKSVRFDFGSVKCMQSGKSKHFNQCDNPNQMTTCQSPVETKANLAADQRLRETTEARKVEIVEYQLQMEHDKQSKSDKKSTHICRQSYALDAGQPTMD
uniref:Ovule protein n=1 Tax=Caenorhabditis tropicalis TaxID=1561998 RepID=A0A1I7U1U3_9PELO